VQLNIGKIDGGEWHGSTPERCSVWCNLGFLPGYSVSDMQTLIKQSILEIDDPWIPDHCVVKFNGLKNDSYMMDPQHDFPSEFYRVIQEHLPTIDPPAGWKVSCDARLYSRILELPTIIFGCGSLNDAHSTHEKVSIDELILGAKILTGYLTNS